jgi:sugar/nucleoside kinase (ribokinase family)
VTNERGVLVIGDYYVDMVFAGLPRWPQPGEEIFASQIRVLAGGAFTHARALHRLRIPTNWAAELGDDPYSRLLLDTAVADGLDTSAYLVHDHPVRNVSVAASHAGERGFLSFKEPVPPRDVTGAIVRHRPAIVLIAELRQGEQLAAVVDAARAVDARVVMDPQHVESTLCDPAVRTVLRSIDVFLPNAAEALRLTGREQLPDAVEDLAALTPVVAVKNGADAALAAHGALRCTATPPEVTVVDTVGAGDCFDAGFVAGLANDLDLDACLRLATWCGSLSTRDYGGAAAPHLDDIARLAPDLVPWASVTPPSWTGSAPSGPHRRISSE